jgi:hypothetical protein
METNSVEPGIWPYFTSYGGRMLLCSLPRPQWFMPNRGIQNQRPQIPGLGAPKRKLLLAAISSSSWLLEGTLNHWALECLGPWVQTGKTCREQEEHGGQVSPLKCALKPKSSDIAASFILILAEPQCHGVVHAQILKYWKLWKTVQCLTQNRYSVNSSYYYYSCYYRGAGKEPYGLWYGFW